MPFQLVPCRSDRCRNWECAGLVKTTKRRSGAKGSLDAPKRSRIILIGATESASSTSVRRRAIRSTLLDSLFAREHKHFHLAAQRQHFITRRFAEVSVVARLSLLEGAGQRACSVGRNEPRANEMFLEQRDDAAVPRRVKISSGE